MANYGLPSGSISPVRVLIEGLFRRRRLFLGSVGTVLLLALLYTLFSKTQYSSEMKYLIVNTRSNAVITSDHSSTSAGPELTEPQINSELEVMQSQDVIMAVTDPGWNSVPVQDRSMEQIKVHEEKVRAFLLHLKVDPVRKSNVITVTFLASTPQEANATLERLSAAYLAQRRNISRPSGTSSFFAEEAKRYQDAWQDANAKLVAFQQQNHLISVPEREDSLSKELVGDQEDLRTGEAAVVESDRRLNESAKALQGMPARHTTALHTSSNPLSIQQFRGLLVELRNRRTELLNRYKPGDRLVVEVDRQIADTAAALDLALTDRATDDTTDINPMWQNVKSSMVEQRVNSAATRSRNASLRHDIGDLKGQLAALQGLAVKFNGLQEMADQTRNNYELFAAKRDQAQIEDAMDANKLVNVAVAERPTISHSPAGSKPLLAVLGSFTALMLGGALVYFAESSRNTIATPRELDGAARYPVLGTIPHFPELEPGAGVTRSAARAHSRRPRWNMALNQAAQNLRKAMWS